MLTLFLFFSFSSYSQVEDLMSEELWYAYKTQIDGTNVEVPLAELELSEIPGLSVYVAGNHPNVSIWFCDDCGMDLWYSESDEDGLYIMDVFCAEAVDADYTQTICNNIQKFWYNLNNRWMEGLTDYGRVSFEVQVLDGIKTLILTDELDNMAFYAAQSALSTSKSKVMSFELYPNPTKDFINIANLQETSILKIFDLSGKPIFQQKLGAGDSQIDIRSLSNGLYIYRIENTIGEKQGKLIIR